MIDITGIYRGNMSPAGRLVAMFNLMKEVSEAYEFEEDIIQPDWNICFSQDADRKGGFYSSPYRINYEKKLASGASVIDYDSKHIQRLDEDYNNIIFLMASGMSFNEVQSEESREILIRKYFLKESTSILSEKMYHIQPNRTVHRRISIAKQEAVEAFGFDLFDIDGDRRNISLVRKERKILRKKLKGC